MIWTDAHISPAVAKWVAAELGHPACSIRDLGLRNAKDKEITILALPGIEEEAPVSSQMQLGRKERVIMNG